MDQTTLEPKTSSKKLAPYGVVVVAHAKNEWLLPWWKLHFLLKNTMGLAFLDLGLSAKGKAWCLQSDLVLEAPKDLSKDLFAALCLSPFEKTLCLQPYMKVCQDLSGVFDYLDEEKSFGGSKDILVGKKGANFKGPSVSLPALYNWPIESSSNPFACLINYKKSTKALREEIKFFEDKLYMNLKL